MSDLPLVSIITPAYNRASFLEETIESVLSQGYRNLQYIILDDGSTDDTRKILRRYAGFLEWETHQNMGETRTVNKGLSMAKGEIAAVVNSDDPLLPGAISTMVDAMRTNPDAIVAYPDWDMVDGRGQRTEHVETYEYSYFNMLRWHHCVPGPGTFFRKWVAETLGGRDVQFSYVADFDFWLRAGLLGQFVRVPRTLATFRWHPGGASSSAQGEAMAEEHVRLVQKIFSMENLPASAKAARREAFGSAYYVAGATLGTALPHLQRRYFRKALALSPIKYFGEYRPRLRIMLPALLGPAAVSAAKKTKPSFRR